MRRTGRIAVAIVALFAGGAGVLQLYPTQADCRASGRVVDPSERHCLEADGYEQLREHVLFHIAHASILGGAALLVGAVAWRVVRRRTAAA